MATSSTPSRTSAAVGSDGCNACSPASIIAIEELAAESEILNNGSTAMAQELTERASRPLISEKDLDVRHKAMEQIVKVVLHYTPAMAYGSQVGLQPKTTVSLWHSCFAPGKKRLEGCSPADRLLELVRGLE